MRILVLCERVDNEGGTESYLRATLPALAAAGDSIRVVARSAAQPHAYGVEAVAVAWSDEHDQPSAAAAEQVASIARDFAPDVTVAHNVLDADVLRAARARRSIYHLHDHRPFCPNGDRLYPQGGGVCNVAMSAYACGLHSLIHGCAYGPRPRTLALTGIREGIASWVRAADTTIVFSEYMGAIACRNGVPVDRVSSIAPPLEDTAYAAAPAPRPSADVVLFAGRVMPSKGARSLVRAVAAIDAAKRPRVAIAGEGPDLAATLDEARALGVALDALGRLDAAALRAAYDNATMVAMPSTWGEPFGLVGIEAFARGRPVVAYDSGGIDQWLDAKTGVLVPRGDEDGLACAIVEMLDETRWRAASAGAFEAARRYRLLDHVARLRAIYGGAA
ncbi:MAG TPA: glycosyltransferase family 4 protein [Candidatus Baltobacteraceae bacterium]